MADLLDHFRRMAANNLWSNDRLYRAVLSLGAGEFEAARTSFFPSIRETLNHILAVDLLYLDFLEEGPLGAGAFDDFAVFDAPSPLFEAQTASDRRLVAFCENITAADIDRCVVTDRREDGKVSERIGTFWRIFSSTRSTIAARCTPCSPARRCRRRNWMNFSWTMTGR
jgi:uncharacterized damage-inducible protein DinB